MDMRIDAERIRLERTNRAWSQEHLASVTNLGLRTIQRIETLGNASNESVSAIASAFELPVSTLLVREPAAQPGGWLQFIATNRLWILLPLLVVVQVTSPPQLSVALAGLSAWAALELVLLFTRRRAVPR